MGLNSEGENWYVTESSISLYDGVGKLSSSPNQSFATDLQVVAPLGSRQVLTVGGSFKHDQSHSKDRTLPNWTNRKAKGAVTYTADGQDVLYGLFVQDEIAITDKLTAYAGLRADWWKVYDGEVNQAGSSDYPKIYASRRDSAYSPKLALVYQPLEQTTCKLSAGKAFRAPSIYDLYRTWSSVSGSKTTIYNANPMLKPETVNAWDMSVKQGLWQGADVEISYFENYLNDLIYRVTVSNTATLNDQIWTNAGKAETKGFTVSANQQVQDWLRLYGNTTVLTSSKVVHNWAGVKNGQNTHGKHLQQLPMRMINLGVEGQYKGLTASLNGRYVSRRFSTDNNSDYADDCYGVYEAYSVADAKLSYTWRENATIAVAIDNLFDRDYWDSYKAPGRTSYVEVGFKF
ncbi:MAG: Colicin I receptor precursor [Deltaproteobacteria bacterium ADurb.Bin510]|nr:MAG: Colicin I receptor precursor [Deltaproteobacteria bacterium ADurb.Bin510]